MRRGQSWSFDVVIATIIFGLITVAISSFALLDEPVTESLSRQGVVVTSALQENLSLCGNLVVDGVINDTVYECLVNTLDYDALRDELNLRDDFCVHLEDEDGRLIVVNDSNAGFGSGNAVVGGIRC